MFDPTYILVLIGFVLCLAASAGVKNAYAKYARVPSRCGMSGAETTARILQMKGYADVQIGHIGGDLTDHYNPSDQQVNLSDSTYAARSVAAVSVAAHECGHVCQNHEGYLPLRIRTALVPVANIGSNLGLPMVIIGLILGAGITASGKQSLGLVICNIGIFLFLFGVLFQLVTLPVEFDASRRGLAMLQEYGILAQDEIPGARKVLRAAAMTYVAAAASSLLQLLRLILLSGSGRRRSD